MGVDKSSLVILDLVTKTKIMIDVSENSIAFASTVLSLCRPTCSPPSLSVYIYVCVSAYLPVRPCVFLQPLFSSSSPLLFFNSSSSSCCSPSLGHSLNLLMRYYSFSSLRASVCNCIFRIQRHPSQHPILPPSSLPPLSLSCFLPPYLPCTG